MVATALSALLVGLDAHLVRVEVATARGVPSFELVGVAQTAVRESRVRVRRALLGLGVDVGEHAMVVNLAPADLPKGGSGFDLAIATAAACALGVVPRGGVEGTVFLGELSLTGALEEVRGVLPKLLGARARGVRRAVVPVCHGGEAGLVEGLEVYLAATFQDVITWARGQGDLATASQVTGVASLPLEDGPDLAEVRGQHGARRALEIAAAGGHGLLLLGPPGAGKTMLARRLPGLLPPLSADEALEVAAIHSVAGLLRGQAPTRRVRPFRAPHHTASDVGLVGGGRMPTPGEVSLAHHGVLFLDELPEFGRRSLEALRQPLEDGVVAVARAHARATFPARPLLAAAMNPCPCGYLGDGTLRCHCSPERVRAYRGRVSGPIVDRIDLHVVVPAVPVATLREGAAGETSEAVAARVLGARQIQRSRARRGITRHGTNGTLDGGDLRAVAQPCDEGQVLLAAAVERLGLSARAYTKVLRVARTIADLEKSDGVRAPHIVEAVGLRVLDRSPLPHAAHDAA